MAKNNEKQRKITEMLRPATASTPNNTNQIELRKSKVDDEEQDSSLPVKFSVFWEQTNIHEVALAKVKQLKPQNYKHYLGLKSEIRYARKLYRIFYSEPEERQLYPLNILKVHDSCPLELKQLIYELPNKNEATPSNNCTKAQPVIDLDNQPSTSRAARSSREELQSVGSAVSPKKMSAASDIQFPITFKEFQKFTHYNEIVEAILLSHAKGDNVKFQNEMKSVAITERVAYNVYQAFYMDRSFRKKFNLRLKPCTVQRRERILRFPQADGEDHAEIIETTSTRKRSTTEMQEDSNVGKKPSKRMKFAEKSEQNEFKDEAQSNTPNKTIFNTSLQLTDNNITESPSEKSTRARVESIMPVNTNTNSQPDSDSDDQPSTSKKALLKLQRSHANAKSHSNVSKVCFPIKFNEFVKYTDCNNIVEEILRNTDKEKLKKLKEDNAYLEKATRSVYVQFYTDPNFRNKFNLTLKPCPVLMRQKIWKFAETVNKDGKADNSVSKINTTQIPKNCLNVEESVQKHVSLNVPTSFASAVYKMPSKIASTPVADDHSSKDNSNFAELDGTHTRLESNVMKRKKNKETTLPCPPKVPTVVFPIKFEKFLKLTNYHKIVHKILRKKANGDNAQFKKFKDDDKYCKKVAYKVYKDFCTDVDFREKFNLTLKACPMHMRAKILKIPTTDGSTMEGNNNCASIPMPMEMPPDNHQAHRINFIVLLKRGAFYELQRPGLDFIDADRTKAGEIFERLQTEIEWRGSREKVHIESVEILIPLEKPAETEPLEVEPSANVAKAKRIFFHNFNKRYTLPMLLRTSIGLKQQIIRAIMSMSFEDFRTHTHIHNFPEIHTDCANIPTLERCYRYAIVEEKMWPTNLYLRLHDLIQYLLKKQVQIHQLQLQHISPILLHWEDLSTFTNFDECVCSDYKRDTGRSMDDYVLFCERRIEFYNKCNWFNCWLWEDAVITDAGLIEQIRRSDVNRVTVERTLPVSIEDENTVPFEMRSYNSQTVPISTSCSSAKSAPISTTKTCVIEDDEDTVPYDREEFQLCRIVALNERSTPTQTQRSGQTASPTISPPASLLTQCQPEPANKPQDGQMLQESPNIFSSSGSALGTHQTKDLPSSCSAPTLPADDSTIFGDSNFIGMPATQTQNDSDDHQLIKCDSLLSMNSMPKNELKLPIAQHISSAASLHIAKCAPISTTKTSVIEDDKDSQNDREEFPLCRIVALNERSTPTQTQRSGQTASPTISPPTLTQCQPEPANKPQEGQILRASSPNIFSSSGSSLGTHQTKDLPSSCSAPTLPSDDSTIFGDSNFIGIPATQTQIDSLPADDHQLITCDSGQTPSPIISLPASLLTQCQPEPANKSQEGQILRASPNIFLSSGSSLGTHQTKDLPSSCSAPILPSDDSTIFDDSNFIGMPATQAQIDSLPADDHELITSDPLLSMNCMPKNELKPIAQHISSAESQLASPPSVVITNLADLGATIKTEPFLDKLQFSINDDDQIDCRHVSQEPIVIDSDDSSDRLIPSISYLMNTSRLNSSDASEAPLVLSPVNSKGEYEFVTTCLSQRLPSSLESVDEEQHEQQAKRAIVTSEHVTKATTTSAAASTKTKVKPGPKTDFVPQLTHEFRPLLLKTVHKTVKPIGEAAVTPSVSLASSTSARQNVIPESITVSQALNTDSTFFNNSELLRIADQYADADCPSTSSKGATEMVQVNKIDSCQVYKLERTVLYRSLQQFHYFSELTEQHIAKYCLPSMGIGQSYMQAHINWGSSTKLYGHCLKTLLPYCSSSLVLNDLLFVLSDLKEYHYNSFMHSRDLSSIHSLRERVLFYFFKTSPGFSHCHLRFDCASLEYGCGEPITSLNDKTRTRTPHCALENALKPSILERIAKLKGQL